MIVANAKELHEFMGRNYDSRKGIERWLQRVRNARFMTPHDVLEQMSNVIHLGNGRFIFNINGNRFRLIALVDYENQSMDVRFVGTHADYNRVNAKEV